MVNKCHSTWSQRVVEGDEKEREGGGRKGKRRREREEEEERDRERRREGERGRGRAREREPVIHLRRHRTTTRRESEVAEQRRMVDEAMCLSHMESDRNK